MTSDGPTRPAAADPAERLRLREAFLALVEGRLGTAEYADLYYGRWRRSPDRGIAEVARFWFDLFSDDADIRRIEALPPELRPDADRCALFLLTDAEYGWPRRPGVSWAGGCLSLLGVVLASWGLVPAVLALVVAAEGKVDGGLVIGVLAAAVLVPAVAMFRLGQAWSRGREAAYWTAGDRDAWPFLTRADYRRAAKAD